MSGYLQHTRRQHSTPRPIPIGSPGDRVHAGSDRVGHAIDEIVGLYCEDAVATEAERRRRLSRMASAARRLLDHVRAELRGR